jgi:hypothetical protein
MELTNAFFKALEKAPSKEKEDDDNYWWGGPRYFTDSSTCCGVIELSELPENANKIAGAIRDTVEAEGTRRIVYYNRSKKPQIKILKSFGFKQAGDVWVNPVHRSKLVQLYFDPTKTCLKPTKKTVKKTAAKKG